MPDFTAKILLKELRMIDFYGFQQAERNKF